MTEADLARAVIDRNRYMTLATADERGTPWATPVWFAHSGYRELFWISRPGARHSRNIAARPEIAVVVFDSHSIVGTAQAVYMAARAEQVAGEDLEDGVAVFSDESVRQGLEEFTVDEVAGEAEHRLYRATVTEHSLLDAERKIGDFREPVEL
jgi:nitroimidazol reductase NimA-like FMN-containing flavoprotein (pyridoxamine 5'-phosphate oxidase superfamily)